MPSGNATLTPIEADDLRRAIDDERIDQHAQEAPMTTNTVTLVGNVTRDPDLRYTAGGTAVATFGLAMNERRKEGDKWVDGDTSFFNVTCWQEMGEHVASSLTKGTRVIVTGRLKQRTYEKDGENRSVVEVIADEVGPSLRWADAEVVRNEREKVDTNGPGKGDLVYGDEEPF